MQMQHFMQMQKQQQQLQQQQLTDAKQQLEDTQQRLHASTQPPPPPPLPLQQQFQYQQQLSQAATTSAEYTVTSSSATPYQDAHRGACQSAAAVAMAEAAMAAAALGVPPRALPPATPPSASLSLPSPSASLSLPPPPPPPAAVHSAALHRPQEPTFAPLQPHPAPPQPTMEPIDPAKAQLGKGVFAKVRMTHGRDGSIVAVKTYDHKEAKQEKSVAKHMLNEERLAGKIQHENIIAPMAVRHVDGATELEMEYAPGGTLEEHVKRLRRPLTEAEARKYFTQIVDAVVYLHANGISHRDIKLENVVLDADGNAKLVDFGAAREGGADKFLVSMQGTPAYMAPEVAMQRAHKGGPADVWALGVVLYNLVSGGAFPFWGKNMDDLRRNITAQGLRFPANLSAPCRDLLTLLLQKSSAVRVSASDVRKHPWLGTDAPAKPASAAQAMHTAENACGAAPSQPSERIFSPTNMAIAAEAAAAATAAARADPLHAARAAASKRLQQQQPPPSGESTPAASPRTGYATPTYAPNFPAGYAPPGSRPSTAGSAPSSKFTVGSASSGGLAGTPRSASKLAGLMSGNGRPGTPAQAAGKPVAIGHSRASSAANLGFGIGGRR